MSKQQEKQKKPIYKKWWAWVIAVFILIGIMPSSDEEVAEENDTGQAVEQEEAEAEEPEQDEPEKTEETEEEPQNNEEEAEDKTNEKTEQEENEQRYIDTMTTNLDFISWIMQDMGAHYQNFDGNDVQGWIEEARIHHEDLQYEIDNMKEYDNVPDRFSDVHSTTMEAINKLDKANGILTNGVDKLENENYEAFGDAMDEAMPLVEESMGLFQDMTRKVENME